jgi:hypothetical protein
MNDLLKEKIFSLLSESFYVTNEEMQKAYEDFLTRIEKLNQSESDYLNFFRVLNLTRIEFYSLGSLSFYEQGEKCA